MHEFLSWEQYLAARRYTHTNVVHQELICVLHVSALILELTNGHRSICFLNKCHGITRHRLTSAPTEDQNRLVWQLMQAN